jgi:prepilin signal peptidase PulO-like enzyme (type II secretory pathway)
MSGLPLALGWGVLGAGVGLAVNQLSRRLAKIEEVDHNPTIREEWIAPILTAVLFAAFAFRVGLVPLLLIDSVYVAILVQVLAFDLKHRLILDLVMFPSWVIAFGLAFVTPWNKYLSWPAPDWRTALIAGLIAGGVFAVLYFLGTILLGAEAFGFGDVKLAVFIGMVTGLTDLRMVHALLAGIYIGGLVAIVLLVARRARLRQAVPYAPFLVAGTLLTLLVQQP